MTFWELISKFVKIWKQFGLHFGIKNPLRSKNIALPRGIKNWSDFYTHFYWFLASFWGPCLSHVRHQEPPKTAQEPPKMPSEGVWEASWSQEPPKRRPDPLRDSILDLQTSILVPPDLNFGRFLHVILLIFKSFGDHFLYAK